MLQLHAVIFHTTKQIYKITILIIIYFYLSSMLKAEEYPAGTAEYFYVTLVVHGEFINNIFSEQLFAADP